MNFKLSIAVFALLCCVTAFQCKTSDERPPEVTEGYAPVYGNPNEVNNIKTLSPQPVINTGKIYTINQLVYQVEIGKGLHVIDISDVANPVRTHFIQLAGVEEMSIVNNFLYANNFNDLVTVDISNLNAVKEINRVPNAFHLVSSDKPPMAGWFECVDPSKGVVIGWQLKTLQYPKCRW